MNRIEEIKKSNDRRKELMNERKDELAITREIEYKGLVDRSVEHIEYLLAKLEQAEKALKGVANVIEVQSATRDIGTQEQWDAALLHKVNEAIAAIRS